jgi:hypothetical protein
VTASRDFLQYWLPEQADFELTHEGPFIHSASDQFYRVRSGDTVWLVTVYEGELLLLGRVRVGERVDLETAKRRLGSQDIFEAKYHIIAEHSTREPLRVVSLTDIAGDLRFRSKVNDRLNLRDGRVNAQQLQTLRELAPKSVALLSQRWSGDQRMGESASE